MREDFSWRASDKVSNDDSRNFFLDNTQLDEEEVRNFSAAGTDAYQRVHFQHGAGDDSDGIRLLHRWENTARRPKDKTQAQL